MIRPIVMFGRMEAGTLVEYIDRQKIVCAVVLENKGQRLRLLSENDREVSLSEGRLLHVSDARIDPAMGRDRLLTTLRETAASRSALAGGIDVPAVWEVLSETPEWVDTDTVAGLVFGGPPSADHQAAVVRAFFENRTYFKFEPGRFLAHTPEQVELIRHQSQEAERRQHLVEVGGRWLARAKAGEAGATLPPDDRQAVTEVLRSYFLFEKESPHSAVGKAICARAGLKSSAALFSPLVAMGVFQPDENLDLIRCQVPVDFDVQLQDAAHRISASPVSATDPSRQDLTHLPVITIDGVGTRDFDDALSIEKQGDDWQVGVHIVDVGHLVRREDPLDLAARQRASSIYMPDQRIPMLPLPLSEGVCSLVAGQVRPAISVLAHVTESAQVISWRVVPSYVCVARQLTYDQVNDTVGADPILAVLHQVACQFRRQRLENGAVQIVLPEVNVATDGCRVLDLQRMDRESPGRMLVAELMILANWLMTRTLCEKKLAAIFRSQPEPKERLYRGEEGTLFQNWMQRRLLSRFVLGTQPEKHSGLGLDVYATATSPVRKYLDLITQRQLRASFGLEAAYSAEELDRIVAVLKPTIQQVALLQRSRHRYWILKYLESRTGKKETAVILARRRNAYQILMPQYMIECDLPAGGSMQLKPEQTVEVTIQRVDARQDVLAVFL